MHHEAWFFVRGLLVISGALLCAASCQAERPRERGVRAAAVSSPSFVEFETGHVRPVAMSPDGTRLFAVDTPNGSLEIFDVSDAGLALSARVPVGLEPVAVAARTSSEVWVVNQLSDSVSVVTLTGTPHVVRTLLVGDEHGHQPGDRRALRVEHRRAQRGAVRGPRRVRRPHRAGPPGREPHHDRVRIHGHADPPQQAHRLHQARRPARLRSDGQGPQPGDPARPGGDPRRGHAVRRGLRIEQDRRVRHRGAQDRHLRSPADQRENLAPIVGQQVTLTSANAGAVGPRITLLEQRAGAAFTSKVLGGAVRECDLVARVAQGGVIQGFLYDPASGRFAPAGGGGSLSDGDLRALPQVAGQEVTLTCVPPGSGARVAATR